MFSCVLHLLTDIPRIVIANRCNLVHPALRRAYPLHSQLNLLVCKLPGNSCESLAFQQTLLRHARTETIVPSDNEPDEAKNEECCAELIRLFDDKSLSLVMRDAAGDGRKALQILRDHYASQGKPRIIALYTELASLEKGENESVTDQIIRAEKSVTALKNAKEKLSDGLVIAIILKGLPDAYKPFVVHVTQSAIEITFPMFKCQLKSFEETEKFHYKPKTDQVMKIQSLVKQCKLLWMWMARAFYKGLS